MFDADGRAACRVYVESQSNTPCPEAIGWFEPAPNGENPPPETDTGQRLCEVRQLEGAALQSCRTELECAECEPGFCFTDVESLTESCSAQGLMTVPRFVNGAGRGEPGRFTVVCSKP